MASYVTPTIAIDLAEPNDSVFGRENGDPLKFNVPTEVKKLYTGDYSVVGLEHLFAVELKKINDIVACCCSKSGKENRERFERELNRLRGYRFARVLIIGSYRDLLEGNYRSKMNPVSVTHSLSSFTARYGTVPILFAKTPQKAVMMIEEWAASFSREIMKEYSALMKSSPQLKDGWKL